ncbi:MAG: chromosomal replication initiator DnaA [Pseudomonadota bacterium]|jgi:chromosomal replication initiation ATPase DnaA|uniref:Chromosomal replication initiation ATPase DnaA n=1 Tax=Brevundimonas aurantiaca TaxID=74316 RepID=A0A7W9F8N8_9CAUL|nr:MULTISPECIES: chromosomal replication initiator DnaA [Brevundimonas]MEC8457219.1 chromosomal replication initiator DnaA [Pseudomonadota bacterium]MBB5740321.1 chromosomal replication initiation ATPase DnaA [Brevundimonas aurantiaca]MBD3838061.1 chromosomal replication initiator DnaA [Brevundimonas sp.]MBJ7510431.1 chromosomal replication initiator DnaA [Brevundimonas sp.]MCC4295520.1 chromosomal replication initiator DnaA [Brevundimonas aurantiaca]
MVEAYRAPVREADRCKAGLALHLVAARTGASPDRMTAGRRIDPLNARSRWLAMYLAHIAFGWTLERVGHVFGVNRSTVGAACRWVEDERDRRAVDELLSQLEACLTTVYSAPRWEAVQ